MNTSANNKHCLSATIGGIVCTATNERLGKSISVNAKTIARHLSSCEECKKVNTDNGKINYNDVLNNMQGRVEAIYHCIAKAPNSNKANEIINQYLPQCVKVYACNLCTYTTNIKANATIHLNSKKCKRGTITVEEGRQCKRFKVTLSQTFLSKIKEGGLILPWKATQTNPAISDNQYNYNGNTTHTTITPADTSLVHITTPATNNNIKSASKFIASEREMTQAIAVEYRPKAATLYFKAITHMKATFGDDKFEAVWPYINLFLHKIDHESNIGLKAYLNQDLTLIQPNRYDSTQDTPSLKLLLGAGKLWLISQAANLDVRQLDAGMRSKLYQIGTAIVINEEEKLKGKTFVPTAKVDRLLSEFQSLMIYLHRKKWKGMQTQLQQILTILESVGGLEKKLDDDEEENLHNRILDTNIVPGILMSVMLDTPNIPNGSVIIDDYIALSSVKLDGNKDIVMRPPNEIGKLANYLLRLGRHAAASHINRIKIEITHQRGTNNEYCTLADSIIKEVRDSDYTDVCCTTIRLGREISNKSPTDVWKAFDPVTGEIVVGQVSISKSVWSKAIPTTIGLLNKEFQAMFQCPEKLNIILDTSNQVNWAGNDTAIVVFDSDSQTSVSYPVSDIIPTLTEETSQQTVNNIWKLLRFSMAYLSSGATRGSEAERIASLIDNAQIIFNMYRFQTYSKKNEWHGQCNNTKVERHLPPSITRYALVAYISLFPVVMSNETLSLPQDSSASEAIADVFKTVMGLSQSVGCKASRDLLTQATNYSFPKHTTKTSTIDEFAHQFSHSSEVHDIFYSSEVFTRDGEGRIIHSCIMIARHYHTILGEQINAYGPQRIAPRHICLDKDMLNNAARHSYCNSQATVTPLQLDAITIIDDDEDNRNAMVLMGCGTGKSGLYILPLAARALYGMKRKRIVVISPHNPLLYQHHQQALRYFNGLNLRVSAVENVNDINSPSFEKDFDLCFISIHAFNTLVSTQRNVIDNWKINIFFIDEIHLMYSEFFRHETSWNGLHNLSVFGGKIVCMSATITEKINRHIQHYLLMGDTVFIGDPTSTQKYHIPDVAINVKKVSESIMHNEAMKLIQIRFKALNWNGNKGGIHVITQTKSQAELGAAACMSLTIPIQSFFITSECTKEERKDRMRRYSCNKDPLVIWTTYDVGFDSSLTADVIILGSPKSVIAFIQAMGRIRMQQQRAKESNGTTGQINVLLSNKLVQKDKNEERNIINIMTRRDMLIADDNKTETVDTASFTYTKLFTSFFINKVWNNKGCYRKSVLMGINVTSDTCGMCTNCFEHNNSVIMKNLANNALQLEQSDREFVVTRLKLLETHCYICKDKNCNGTNCMRAGKFCLKCHSKQCAGRNKEVTCDFAKPAITKGCVYCWLPQYLRRGTFNEFHGINKCVHKERIKRVLLFDCKNGKDAKQRLEGCWNLDKDFIQICAKQLRLIDNKRRGL